MKGWLQAWEYKAMFEVVTAFQILLFLSPLTCCYELSSFSDLPKASGEAARAKLFPQRPEIPPDSFF